MSVTVAKFKLEGRGYQGVKISGTETREKDGLMVVVDIEMNFKVPIPTEIFATVQRLKRYMLDLCGYWHPSFDQFIKQGKLVDMPLEGDRLSMYQHLMSLMDSAEVSGVVNKEAFFIITGKISNALGGIVGLSTPMTGPSNGYDRWDFLNRGCRQCLTEVETFVNERRLRLMPAKQYALWDEKDPERIEQVESMNEEELLQAQIKNLESRGAVVMMPSDYGRDEEPVQTVSDPPPGSKIPDNPDAKESAAADLEVTGDMPEIVLEEAAAEVAEEVLPEGAEVAAASDLPESKE